MLTASTSKSNAVLKTLIKAGENWRPVTYASAPVARSDRTQG